MGQVDLMELQLSLRERGGRVGERRRDNGSRGRVTKGPKPKNTGGLWKAGNARKQILPQSLQKGTQPRLAILDF